MTRPRSKIDLKAGGPPRRAFLRRGRAWPIAHRVPHIPGALLIVSRVTSRPKPTALSGCEGAGTPRAGGTAITPLETANGIGDFVPSLRCSEEIELEIVRSCWFSDMPRHRITALLLCLSA